MPGRGYINAGNIISYLEGTGHDLLEVVSIFAKDLPREILASTPPPQAPDGRSLALKVEVRKENGPTTVADSFPGGQVWTSFETDRWHGSLFLSRPVSRKDHGYLGKMYVLCHQAARSKVPIDGRGLAKDHR
mmetsp:Transcript_2963/g.5552  ORF Transcript_2963/g.5552 Transcript_2963/m.5552 type:complete len:132 (-) Transcript_2963:462-857(-)